MKALVIRPGATSIEPLELSEDDTEHYNKVQSTIGNWFTSCFNIRTKAGRIIGLCDDEFLLRPIAPDSWSCAIGDSLRSDAPYPIGGPVVILGYDELGENRSLTDEETSHFTLSLPARTKQGSLGFLQNIGRGLYCLQWEG